jgi:two-component system, NarL family, nitrate/nitrite response regulator NarL
MRRPFDTVMVPLGEGLAKALIATDFRIVASTSRAGDLAQISVAQDQPVLLIIDASDEQNEVVSQIKLFRRQYSRGRVAVVADRYRRSDVISAYRAGANAYLTKDMSCGAFLKTLELVTLGETVLPPELLPFIRNGHERHEHRQLDFQVTETQPPHGANAPPPDRIGDDPPPLANGTDALRSLGTDTVPPLSARERCILRCIAEGCSNKSIARRIDIAEATVKVHVKAILRKIRVCNRTQAAIWAVNNSSLVWSASADSPSARDDGHAAIDARESHLFDAAAGVNGAKQDCARMGTQRPIRKQIS